jgi:hypothetical protein
MPEEPEYIDPRTERAKNRRHLLIALACIGGIVLLIGGPLAVWMFRTKREKPAASALLPQIDESKISEDLRELRRVLKANPNDIAANRAMGDKAEAAGSRAAIELRKRVVALEPNAPENQVALANTAIRFKDIATAKEALGNVPAEARETVAFREAETRLALVMRDSKAAEAALAAAVALEPEKEVNQLNLAILRLASTNPTVRAEARKSVEAFAAKPELRRTAMRALISVALQEKNYSNALEYGRQLRMAEGSSFQDGLYYLHILRQLKRIESSWCLAQLMQEAAGDANKVAELMAWLNRNGLPQQTLDWSQQLPGGITSKLLVTIATAEAAAILGQWETVKPLVTDANWERLEFRRLALLARVAREDGDDTEAQTNWVLAVENADKNKQAQIDLIRMASEWKWDNEAIELLWRLSRESPDPMPVLAVLQKKLLAAGDTRQLRDVSNRILELRPKDLAARNNLAYYHLLLKDDVEEGLRLANEVYQEAPKLTPVIATYAFALHAQGKNDQARKLMQAQTEKTLMEPGQALCYALILASTGAKDDARKYFEVAKSGNLLPEEKQLIPEAP